MKPSSKLVKDRVFLSTQDDHAQSSFNRLRLGEKETTTGWQFATQIGDEEDISKFEIVGNYRESNNRSALLIRNQHVLPSMLDPAFEEEDPSPRMK